MVTKTPELQVDKIALDKEASIENFTPSATKNEIDPFNILKTIYKNGLIHDYLTFLK